MFAESDRLSEAFEELKEKLEDESEGPIKVPKDLEAQSQKAVEGKSGHHVASGGPIGRRSRRAGG